MNKYKNDLEDRVRALSRAQQEWLVRLELANQRRLKGDRKKRLYMAEKWRERALTHIETGGGDRVQ